MDMVKIMTRTATEKIMTARTKTVKIKITTKMVTEKVMTARTRTEKIKITTKEKAKITTRIMTMTTTKMMTRNRRPVVDLTCSDFLAENDERQTSLTTVFRTNIIAFFILFAC